MSVSNRVMVVIALTGANLASQPASAQSDDIHRTFEEVGFVSASKLRERGAEGFRIWLHDPYFMLGNPAVDVTRDGGIIKATAAYATRDQPRKLLWTKSLKPLTIEQWDALKLLEAKIKFDRPPDGALRGNNHVVCHGWSAEIETGPDRAGSWWGCSDKLDDPKFAFVDLLAKELLAANRDCVRSGKSSDEFENFWEFATCFGPRPQLDDPELEERRADLARKWAELYNGNSLLAARTLMRRIERERAPMGGPLWREAKKAAEVVRSKNEKLNDLSIEAYRVSASKKSLSDADRVKLDGWVKNWNLIVQAQDDNYRELLQNLVDARLP